MGEENGLPTEVLLLDGRDGGGGEVALRLRIGSAEDDGFVDSKPFGNAVVVAGKYGAGVLDEVRDDLLG